MPVKAYKLNLLRGVGRRILILFLVAALVPMLFTLGLAHYELGRSQNDGATSILKSSAKEFGVDIKTRLDFASQKAFELIRLSSRQRIDALADQSFYAREFQHIWKLGDAAPEGISRGGTNQFVLREAEMENIRLGRRQLVLSDQGRFVLLVASGTSSNQTYGFQLTDQAMWGDRDALPLNMDFCIFTTAGIKVHCTWSPPVDLLQRIRANGEGPPTSLTAEFADGNDSHHAVVWQLFLRGSFGAESLNIVATQEKTLSKATATEIKRIFLPSVALVLVLVCVLSYYQIGGQLRPLHYLTHSARRIARGEFESRVHIKTGDEFELLGSAFNNMATRIGRQVAALEAMSSVDQLILSGERLAEISQQITEHLIQLTGCQSAGVIARNYDSAESASMFTVCCERTNHNRIALNESDFRKLDKPFQAELSTDQVGGHPFANQFLEYGQPYVVVIPTKHKGEVMGLLLLGFKSEFDLSHPSIKPCLDLASRIAVALSSVEREEALYRQAHFDALTGLPNRQLLKDRLSQYLTSARVDSHSGAILFIDLDRFKEINDVFGHSVGDLVLTQAADRILSQVRERDTVARLGGDEFVVLLPNVDSDSIVRSTAERLLGALSDSFTIRETDHYVSASIGIAMFPDDGATVESLLKNADAAMYRAKDSGRNRFEFFSKQMNAVSRRKITIERDLRTAFQNGDLEVYYQPQFEIATSEVSGAEALLRWHHPKRGAISPGEFIPLAEDSELIVEIGAWVLQQACADLRSLLERDLHPGSVSINVSARQLADKSLRQAVLDPMRENGITPSYMQLEVTETTVAQNKDIAVDVLQSLREDGVRVALDDFGTGYSSLSYLEQMPFDVIKIDKSFISRIGTSKTSDNICRTIIRMAEQLGKKSIAEGVETEAQLSFLKDSRCDYLQGYYYSVPLSPEDFKNFVAKQDLHTKRRKALEIISS